MSIQATNISHGIHGHAAPFAALSHNVFTSIDNFRKARRLRDELEALTDRDLADLGLARCDIRAFVAKARRDGTL